MAILQAIGLWLLKTFLSGVFGTIETHTEDHMQEQTDAALLKAQTVEEGAAVEVASVKLNQTISAQAAQDAKNRPDSDPFGAEQWNKTK